MAIITYDGDEFKSIDCIPEYADYPTIYVAKTPHVDETGRTFQVINTAWGAPKNYAPDCWTRSWFRLPPGSPSPP